MRRVRTAAVFLSRLSLFFSEEFELGDVNAVALRTLEDMFKVASEEHKEREKDKTKKCVHRYKGAA